MKTKIFLLSISLILMFFVSSIECAVINQWTWETEHGTFVLNERIATKVANGEKLIFKATNISPASPIFRDVERGFSDKMKELLKEYPAGVKMILIGPADAVIEKQVSELETIISSGDVDGLAIATGEVGSMEPMFVKAWEAGIPAISWDLDSPGAQKLAYVGPASFYDIGRENGKGFVEFHHEKTGKLALFAAYAWQPYARGNFQGFLDVLNEEGYQMDFIGPFALTLDKAIGYGIIESAFLSNPDITGIYVADEFVVVAAKYLERNNLQDKVVLVGKNELQDVLEYVKKGAIKQTVTLGNYQEGKNIVQVLYDFVTKGKTVPPEYMTELVSITSENVDEFLNK